MSYMNINRVAKLAPRVIPLHGKPVIISEDFSDTTKQTGNPCPIKDFKIGPVLANRYRIEREIGVGGMGKVYLAYDPELERRVAIKVTPEISHHLRAEAELAQRFAQENVPHLCRGFGNGYCRENDATYFVMEYVEGRSIKERLSAGESFDFTRSIKIALAICKGLQAMSESSGVPGVAVLHRDIKPANVMLGEDDKVTLIDFGISIRQNSEGKVSCSPGYASPEQLYGQKLTSATDVFSLGITLYEMMIGCHPQDKKEPVFCPLALDLPPSFESAPLHLQRVYVEISDLITRMTSLNIDTRPTYSEIMQGIQWNLLMLGEEIIV